MYNRIKLGYDDITIVPARISTIRHRKECDCYHSDNRSLPIFVAPMNTVVDDKCATIYTDNHVNVVLPRTIPFDKRIELMIGLNIKKKIAPFTFVSFSLNEVQDIFINTSTPINEINSISIFRNELNKKNNKKAYYICIDIANGHMEELINTIKKIKDKYGSKVIIMSGNIANPKTYEDYNKVGCDFVRCNIGSGSRCTTSSNTSIHFGCFSLIKEIWDIKQHTDGKCKIIADGGIKGYGDIQKALLYADYVMIGGLFNKAIDSAGTPVYGKSYWKIKGKKVFNPFKTIFTYGKKIKPKNYKKALRLQKEGKLDIWKEFYGMSTKIAQSKINPNAKLKTSEGKAERQKVEYSIHQWVENEIDYLRSAMSYTNSRTLKEYQNSEWVQLTYRAFNK